LILAEPRAGWLVFLGMIEIEPRPSDFAFCTYVASIISYI